MTDDETLRGAELQSVFKNALESAHAAFSAGDRADAKKIIDDLAAKHKISVEQIIQHAAGANDELFGKYTYLIDELEKEIEEDDESSGDENKVDYANLTPTEILNHLKELIDDLELGLASVASFSEYQEIAKSIMSVIRQKKIDWSSENADQVKGKLLDLKNLVESSAKPTSKTESENDFEIPEEVLVLKNFVADNQPVIDEILSKLSTDYDPSNDAHKVEVDSRIKVIYLRFDELLRDAVENIAVYEVPHPEPSVDKKKRSFVKELKLNYTQSTETEKFKNDLEEARYQLWEKRLELDQPLFASIKGYLDTGLTLSVANISSSITTAKSRVQTAEQWDLDARNLIGKLSEKQQIHIRKILDKLKTKLDAEKQSLFDFWKNNLAKIYDELDPVSPNKLANLLVTIPSLISAATPAQLKTWRKEVQDHLKLAKDQVVATSNNLILENDPRYQKELDPIWNAAEKLISDLNAPLSSESEQERQEIINSIYALFDQRGIPRRESDPSFSNFNRYIEAVSKAILVVATSTQLNAIYDMKAAGRTSNYVLQPMAGPAEDFDLVNETLIYDRREKTRVTNFSALFDMFHFLFEDAGEKKLAGEFAQNMKEIFMQLTVWHTRALTRRKNEDTTGPGGLLEFTKKVYNSPSMSPNIRSLYVERDNATEFEKRFAEALQFASSVWSAMSLKSHERKRLWGLMDPRVKDYFQENPPAGSSPVYPRIKKEYDLLPRYRSDDRKRLSMIRKMLLDIEKILDPSVASLQTQNATASDYDDAKERSRPTYKIAELIYAQSENFRIGSGVEDFYDVKYKNDIRDPEVSNITVMAQEGGPKAANMGLYVEGAWGNQARPDFVEPVRRRIAHGLPPYLRAAQYSLLSPPAELDHWGDGRASLAEIMSVKDGLDKVRWGTGSTNPDKVVYQAANQAVDFLWPLSQMGQAVKPENRFYIDPLHIPLEPNFIINSERDKYVYMDELGWYNPERKKSFLKSLQRGIRGAHTVTDAETSGFDALSTPLTSTDKIKGMYKNQRDYWLDAFRPDESVYPRDSMRNYAFIFSRDDTDDGYVNPKVAQKFEAIRTGKRSLVGSPSDNGWFGAEVYPWLRGYMNYDYLMECVFYMLSPNLEGIDKLKPGADLKEAYAELSKDSYEEYMAQTRVGSIGSDEKARLPLNAIQLEWLIFQSMLLLNIIPADPASGKSESQTIIDSGYKLHDGTEVTSRITAAGKIFDHHDLLVLAQKFGMGEGYNFVVEEKSDKKPHMCLRRIDGHPITRQYIFDRLTLCLFLFDRKRLAYSR